jgi:hypothetical protein
MPNPLVVNVALTQPNKTLYIAVDTYAAYTQKATIQGPNGRPLVATGNGEGTRIGFWTYPTTAVGLYAFNVYIQFNDGSGFRNSAAVSAADVSTGTLHQTVVFSEDSGDGDNNDCFVTFMWFSSNT